MNLTNICRYHYKCLKIARGKVKEDDKYTCPICDWRMKIPRDAARPKLEDLTALIDEVPLLPFQPEEEDVLQRIISNAQSFRDNIARYCNPIVSTAAETETMRFYLRKLEGAEVLLAYETNFFRQELHKWSPVAPEAPPILEVSLSTRKPRPTKLQKMLVEYGVDDPDDLPEHAKGKANSLRRKAANAEAAAAAAQSAHGPLQPPSSSAAYGGPAYYSHDGKHDNSDDEEPEDGSDDAHDKDASEEAKTRRTDGDQSVEAVMEDLDVHTEQGKAKALEILGRTEEGRKHAERLWGRDVWADKSATTVDRDGALSSKQVEGAAEKEDAADQMLTDVSKEAAEETETKPSEEEKPTTASLEDEQNGLDAMIDGE